MLRDRVWFHCFGWRGDGQMTVLGKANVKPEATTFSTNDRLWIVHLTCSWLGWDRCFTFDHVWVVSSSSHYSWPQVTWCRLVWDWFSTYWSYRVHLTHHNSWVDSLWCTLTEHMRLSRAALHYEVHVTKHLKKKILPWKDMLTLTGENPFKCLEYRKALPNIVTLEGA